MNDIERIDNTIRQMSAHIVSNTNAINELNDGHGISPVETEQDDRDEIIKKLEHEISGLIKEANAKPNNPNGSDAILGTLPKNNSGDPVFFGNISWYFDEEKNAAAHGVVIGIIRKGTLSDKGEAIIMLECAQSDIKLGNLELYTNEGDVLLYEDDGE